MKITKTAEGKAKLTITREEWEDYGRQAGWDVFDENTQREILKDHSPENQEFYLKLLNSTLTAEEMNSLDEYADRLFSTGVPEEDELARNNALKNVFRKNPSSLEQASDLLQSEFQAYMASIDRPHINQYDQGLSQTAQVDQLQPLDGVQNSDAAAGASEKPKTLKCDKKGCKNVFTFDPSNPTENRCENCR